MKIIQSNVKCGKILIFDDRFYQKLQSLLRILSLGRGVCQTSLSQEWGPINLMARRGMVKAQVDTSILHQMSRKQQSL